MLVFLWIARKMQDIKPWFWKRLIDHIIVFIWTESEKSLEEFLEGLYKFHPNLKFTIKNLERKLTFQMWYKNQGRQDNY